MENTRHTFGQQIFLPFLPHPHFFHTVEEKKETQLKVLLLTSVKKFCRLDRYQSVMSVHKNMLILRVSPETNADTFTQRHTCMEAAVSGTKKLSFYHFLKEV